MGLHTVYPAGNYPPEVQQRLERADATALTNAEAINARFTPEDWQRLSERAHAILNSNRSGVARVPEIWALADDMMAKNGDNVACRRGCSHCCHIAVAVMGHEARYIGTQIGRTPEPAPMRMEFSGFDFGYHNPCTFLVENECSIYPVRPLVCRTQYNLDTDDLLCRLTPPHTSPVPLLDTKKLMELLFRSASNPTLNDIRAWFPPEGA